MKYALGEICEILDTKGDIMITYKYDPYGYIKEITGKTAYIDTIGKLQPLKYKGYINDEETGYYYLQSRYYSPFLKRFISLDDTGILEATQGEILGANLYAYCNNNPIMNEDPTGYLRIPIWLLSITLDVLFLALNSAMMAGYISLSSTIYILARNPWTRKMAQTLLIKKVIPVFVKGLFGKVLTLMRKAIWRITGVVIELGKSYYTDRVISKIKNKVLNNILSVVTSIMTWGGIISLGFDLIDGSWDGYFTIRGR